jgi:hypothetical protein
VNCNRIDNGNLIVNKIGGTNSLSLIGIEHMNIMHPSRLLSIVSTEQTRSSSQNAESLVSYFNDFCLASVLLSVLENVRSLASNEVYTNSTDYWT